MDPNLNEALLKYFADRQVWLADPNTESAQIVLYSRERLARPK